MRTTIPQYSFHLVGLALKRLLVLAVLVAAAVCTAQTPAKPAHAATHKATHARARRAAAQAKAQLAAEKPAEPAEPEMPKWPANEKATPAAVVWDSHGLRIDAANSSLHQILDEVSTLTGAKVDGMGGDQRVFGVYGPGKARDVISQLLQGSGYNVLMVGDQGQGTPRQIVLTARQKGGAQQTASAPQPSDDDSEPEEQPAPPNIRPGFGPGAPNRTPQQIMQEMQQRQQQMQQMQPPQPPH